MAQVQVKFVTTREEYAVPPKAILVPVHFDPKALSETILMLLGKSKDTCLVFDFLIHHTPLRTSLETYLTNEGLSAENLITLEYDVRFPPPVPTACHQTDDWISAVTILSPTHAISTGFDGVVRQWHLPTLTQPAKSQIHRLPLKCIEPYQQENKTKLWVGGLKSTIFELEINQDDPEDNFHVTRELVGHTGSVESLAFLPKDHVLISASFDGSLQLHTLPTDLFSRPVSEELPGPPPVKKRRTTSSKVSSTAVPSLSGPTPTLASSSQWRAHVGGVTSLAVHGSVVVSGGQDQAIRTWDVATQSPLSSVPVHDVMCLATDRGPSGTVVSGHLDGSLRWFDLRQHHQLHLLAKAHLGGCVRHVTHQDPYVVCATDLGLHLYDRRTPALALHALPTDSTQHWFAVDRRHGWILAGGDGSHLELWKEGPSGAFEKQMSEVEKTER